MSSPQGEDTNYAGPYIHVCWALTGVAAVALVFRYVIKTWIRWTLPRVGSPERVWGTEDFLYAIAYGFDIAHMVFVQKSFQDGLGRHMWFLSSDERKGTLNNEFTSQPLAVIASMISRSGMMCFLYNCFNSADKKIRIAIIVCMAIQVVINMVTVVQIIVQCGPNPYHASNRVNYFHYMWDDIPSDGSVTCQSPSVQTTVGFVQGGINSTIDFFLTILSAVQLWRFTIRATDRGPVPRLHLCARIRKMPKQARIRRVWQTVSLSGPLLLSGIASIVKTYLLKSIGDKNDITHNIIPFILWVKIENYSILLATLAPMIRLCASMVSKDNEQSGGYWSHSGSKGTHPGLELGSRPHTQSKGAVGISAFDDDDEEAEEGKIDDKNDWNRVSVQGTHQRGNSHNKPSDGSRFGPTSLFGFSLNTRPRDSLSEISCYISYI